MIFLGTNRRHQLFWVIVVVWFVCTKITISTDLRLTLDSIYSGLLALTGFVFTARTFITFKLNEMIYGTGSYREYVAKLKVDGAYSKELYDPLKSIDKKLGTATYMCLWATILFIVVAFIPKPSIIDLGNNLKIAYLFQTFFERSLTSSAMLEKLCLPFFFKLITDIALIYFGFCLYQMLITVKSLHQNISDIIEHWEKDYKHKG